MTRHRLRELRGREILEARADALAWGFPRSIHQLELLEGHWFRYGPALFWIVADAEHGPGEAGVHIASPPDARRAIDRDEWLRVLALVGDLLGLDAIAVEMMGPKMEALAERYGWTKRGKRWYFSLAGAAADGRLEQQQLGEQAE